MAAINNSVRAGEQQPSREVVNALAALPPRSAEVPMGATKVSKHLIACSKEPVPLKNLSNTEGFGRGIWSLQKRVSFGTDETNAWFG